MIIITRELVTVIREQAVAEAPLEACGYLAGLENRAEAAYPMRNVDQSADHFSLDPKEQFQIVKDVRNRGLRLMAVYHSHPASPARMSEEDKRLAYDPEMIYIIYALQDDMLKAFRIGEGSEIEEVEVEINT